MATTKDCFCPYAVHRHLALPALWHISGWIPPAAFCTEGKILPPWNEAQICQCAWKTGYLLRPMPCTLRAMCRRYSHAVEQPFLSRVQLDMVRTSSVPAHSVWAVLPNCHLWKLISQKWFPSLQSRTVLLFCSTNSATTLLLLRGEKRNTNC